MTVAADRFLPLTTGPDLQPYYEAVERAAEALASVSGVSLELLVRTCRVCGCTDAEACPGGCSWAEADLCSTCPRVPRLPRNGQGVPSSWLTLMCA